MDYKGKTVKILLKDKTILQYKITDPPIARGAEGVIYRFDHKVEETVTTYILKLYLTPQKAARNYAKVHCMFNNPVRSTSENVRLCWPIGMVYDNRTFDFYGFAMQEAFNDSRDLEILSTYHINSSIASHYPNYPQWHDKFELDTAIGLRNRLRLLYKWSLAILELQNRCQIVVADLKPSNVMCTAKGQISIVDIDSMQYKHKGHIYLSTAHSPEYCHPDVHNNKALLMNLPTSFDAYSMAISFYMILTGTHPFDNIINLPPYDQEKYQKVSSMIKAGLYLRGKKKEFLAPVNGFNLHANFDRLPEKMKILFNLTFTLPLDEIPTVKDWCNTLKEITYAK